MKRLIVILVIGCFYSFTVSAQLYLQSKVNHKEINQIVLEIGSWRENCLSDWRREVANLPDSIKSALVKDAERSTAYKWPTLTAMGFLEFKENGNRSNYESLVSARRSNFNKLLLGELAEGKGRFISEIVNGLWLILEESTWVSPAHLYYQKHGIGLPSIQDPYIDLGAGRIAVDVALAYVLFKEEFDKVSKHINDRILYELDRRIIDPYLEREDYWWMSFQNDFINNWNIWINTNVLKTLLLIEQDPTRLANGIAKVMRSADKFVDSYAEDGACEEGPSYWIHSAGELGVMLKWLERASNGRVTFREVQKIANMGSYILNMHISENRYVNFADANAIESPSPIKVWNFGKLYDDSNMKGFASYLYMNRKNKWSHSIADFLEEVAVFKAIQAHHTDFKNAKLAFYESMGLIAVRSGSENDWFFSAIGSYNDVSHNHNDVGSFMLYSKGAPVLIDVGVGTYTAKTFSAKRYDIWNMQSQWHNLPVINGIQQKNGKDYAARDVSMKETKKGVVYAVDIAGAYPKEAQVRSWRREFFIPRSKEVIEVTERYSLERLQTQNELLFLTAVKPKLESKRVQLQLENDRLATLDFAKQKVSLKYEEVRIDDARITRVWGDKIYRIKVTLLDTANNGVVNYKISLDR